MRTITVNGKEYKAVAFDFNTICDLEDFGVSIADIGNKPMSAARGYVALCIGRGLAYGGLELQNHLMNGGNIAEIIDVMQKEIEESDFFRAINETPEETTPTTQSKKRATSK